MGINDFRFIAFYKDTGEYAHFGYDKEMALLRASSDLSLPEEAFVVVEVPDYTTAREYVMHPHSVTLEDALKVGELV